VKKPGRNIPDRPARPTPPGGPASGPGVPPRERPPREPVALPPGVAKVHLKSVTLGSFIYDRMIDKVEGRPGDGDLVAVIDRRGDFFGWAFYNSRSTLALRMLTSDPEMPGEPFITRRIVRAVAFRRDVLKLDRTADAYRLVHAEGDGLPGLIVDRFAEFIVIELFSLAMFQRIDLVQESLVDAGIDVRNVVIRADKVTEKHEGFQLGKLAAKGERSTVITEHGVKFRVELAKGHKTGFFCDQRENRLALAGLTAGKNVLDACCYTGGFTLYAAALGKAKSVTGVDLDETALEVAHENASLNGVEVDFQHDDAFDYIRRARSDGRKWDVVVLDPSKFAPTRLLLETGIKKYSDLNRLAAGVVAPDGLLLTCSCSGLVDEPTFLQTVGRAARSAGRTMQVFRVTGAGPDHPFLAHSPESAYLKAVWARLE
jgi:23S rRNA (cytosine1962-C5)-methyltransferase